MSKKGFDPRYLEGLTFQFSEKEIVEKDGRKTEQNISHKRPLTEDDLLDFKDYGDKVVFTTKNGRKYTRKKGITENKAAGDQGKPGAGK